MPKLITIEDEVNELRKAIKILEWDIPNIQNKDLKGMKERQLMLHKEKMGRLILSLPEIRD